MCSGDGKVDSLAFDTTGDGKLDLILSDAHTEKVWPCSSPPFSQNLSYLLLVSLLFQFVLRMGFQFCTGNRARGWADEHLGLAVSCKILVHRRRCL